jgi:hypothetical protein
MLVFEHFAVTAVLDEAGPCADALASSIAAAGHPALLADLAGGSGERPWYGQLQSWPGSQERGVLFMDAAVDRRGPLWSRHDHVVEHLESLDWEVAYLGHGERSNDPGCPKERSGLQLCDSVPDGLCALALRGQTLRSVLNAMPSQAVTGSFTPTDWLTIAAWLGRDLFRRPRTWLAWPSMAHASSPESGHVKPIHKELCTTSAAHP